MIYKMSAHNLCFDQIDYDKNTNGIDSELDSSVPGDPGRPVGPAGPGGPAKKVPERQHSITRQYYVTFHIIPYHMGRHIA